MGCKTDWPLATMLNGLACTTRTETEHPVLAKQNKNRQSVRGRGCGRAGGPLKRMLSLRLMAVVSILASFAAEGAVAVFAPGGLSYPWAIVLLVGPCVAACTLAPVFFHYPCRCKAELAKRTWQGVVRIATGKGDFPGNIDLRPHHC